MVVRMSTVSSVEPELRAPGLDRGLVLLLAVACGATVANLYYAQPLLSTIAGAFRVTDGTAGFLVTVSQVCYAIGLLLLVPLGDLVDRRMLTAGLLLVCSGGLVVAAAAPAFAELAIALGVVATASVVVQMLIPFASSLAVDVERGRVVGTVISGALTGAILARTVSGLLASAAGWRTPFIMAAGAMALLSVALWRSLPRVTPPTSLPYRQLLRSVATLVATERLLRRRMVYGACGFAGFTLAWTTLAFLLSTRPYSYGDQTIGFFGLAGVAGAIGAQGFGRLTDRGLGRPATGGVLVILLASWGVLALGATSVVAVVFGLIGLDFAVHGQNVLSQTAIYALGSGNASRVTSAYVTTQFVGGAIGSVVASVAWSIGGWAAVCAAGAVIAAIAVGFWLTEFR